MKSFIVLLIYLTVIPAANAQDTLNITGVEGDYWIEYSDSIIQNGKTFYGWRKEDYINDTLFTVEYLTKDKIQPIGEYTGYFPDEKIAFKLTYWYDGEYTELHGPKELYYENGNLKEKGQYCHGFKCGTWKLYNNDGSLSKTTEYNSPIFDTITSFKTAASYKEFLTKDTIFIERVSSFYSYFPCISLGKNRC